MLRLIFIFYFIFNSLASEEYFLSLIKSFAVFASGFSIKWSTLLAEYELLSNWHSDFMYPYPVIGDVGITPKVTNLSWSQYLIPKLISRLGDKKYFHFFSTKIRTKRKDVMI